MTETATLPPSTHRLPADVLEGYWMPFTSNRAFKRAPRLLVGAKDMHYTAADGRRILDGTAGLWCVNAGHCREPIVKANQERRSEEQTSELPSRQYLRCRLF